MAESRRAKRGVAVYDRADSCRRAAHSSALASPVSRAHLRPAAASRERLAAHAPMQSRGRAARTGPLVVERGGTAGDDAETGGLPTQPVVSFGCEVMVGGLLATNNHLSNQSMESLRKSIVPEVPLSGHVPPLLVS